MKNKTIIILTIILAVLIVAAVIYFKKGPSIFTGGPSPTGPSVSLPAELTSLKLNYQVAGCDNKQEKKYVPNLSGPENFSYSTSAKAIDLTQKLNYVCCAKIEAAIDSVEERPDFTLINIKEKNTKDVCECLCDYKVEMEIGPLAKGNYLIHLWGVEFENQPALLLWGQNIPIQ